MRRVTGDRPSHLILRYKNRRSWRIDVFWFLELEEELGLFRRNHFYVSFALPTAELLALIIGFVRQKYSRRAAFHGFGQGAASMNSTASA